MERLDRALIRLMEERAVLAQKIGQMNQASGQPPFLFGDEEEAVLRAAGAAKGPLSAAAIQTVFRELVSSCRSLVHEPSVAFLGPLYSYSHLAAIHRFGRSVRSVPVGSISAVFEEVNRGQSDFGIVPLENSTDGRVADTLDMFARVPVRICGEVELEIHHALLGRCQRADVKEVYSRPQALSQCRNWLAKHLPAARTIEVTSTSTAAQLAAEKPGAAAVASLEAGVHYGLNVLAEQIEDNPGNATRFAVIGDQPARRTGRDKTALMFQVEHRPGGLADAINVFKRHRLNMTWIESFPIPGSKRAYLFFVELEGHQTEPRLRRAIGLLGQKTLRLEVLGSFPCNTGDEAPSAGRE
ncbi:MAG: prephenate dehydratase [Thermoguttaceae bacterium]|jgi:chorismate mutase/prephenate dehydratase|nr:prephenate dehydratase [Thermoguttaceae bacterium]